MHRGGAFLILLGMAGWLASLFLVAAIPDSEAADQVMYLAASVVLAVVGASFLILGAMYDIANRRR